MLGTDDVGYWSDVNAMGLLKLGADEVIPHGTGKGALVFNGAKRGVLDLNGKTETVNTLIANGDLCLSNSAVQAGVLRAGVKVQASLRSATFRRARCWRRSARA